MQNFDYIFIGAGISTYGAVAALLDSNIDRKRVLVITGGSISRPELAMSRFAPSELEQKKSLEQFGLPAIRAFGDGGTSRLWHGGLFVPHPLDEIRSIDGQNLERATIPSALELTTLSPTLKLTKITQLLRAVRETYSLDIETRSHHHWRKLVVPRKPPLLRITDLENPDHAGTGPRITYDNAYALQISCEAHSFGRTEWTVQLVDERGFRSVSADQLFICSGCLTSLKLLAQLAKTQTAPFSDHLHVFAGTLHLPKVPRELHARLSTLKSVDGHSIRSVWKTTVFDRNGRIVDVALSFRRVADADFPRAGRRFGEMVGARATSIQSKVLLGLKNPLTAIEMLAFKNGFDLPFSNALIHATIAPRYSVGNLSGNELVFNPDRDELSRCAVKAVAAFAQAFSLGSHAIRTFPEPQIAGALISGAQFCASEDAPPELLELISSHNSSLTVCDTSSISFSSVHNQGLLTLLQSYSKSLIRVNPSASRPSLSPP